MTNIMKKFADNMVKHLGESLKDADSRIRLQEGVYLMIGRPINGMSLADSSKTIIPAFTRTIYDRHGFDIPVPEYVDKMYEFFEQWKLLLDVNSPIDGDIDKEATALESLTQDFMASFK